MAQTTQFTTTSAISYEASDSDPMDHLATAVFYETPQSSGEKARHVARRLAPTSLGSPMRRSPRLSALPSPLLQRDMGTQGEEECDDDSDSVNDVAAHLSREETPENDPLPQDEPSSILASKIMRAHDNPSPPPPNRAHSGTSYITAKDGQFPLLDGSLPSDPFRGINHLERLMRGRSTEGSDNFSPTPANNEPDSNDPRNIPQEDLISFDSCSGATESLPLEQASSDNSTSANSSHIVPSAYSTVDDLLSSSPQRLSSSGAHMDSTEQDVKIDEPEETDPSEANTGPPKALVSSLASTSIPVSNSPPRTPLRRSSRKCSARDSLTFNAATILGSSSSEENTSAVSVCAGNEDPVIQINSDGMGASPAAGSGESTAAGEGRNGGRKIAKGEESQDGSTLERKLGSLSPQSADVLTRLLTSSQPNSTLKQPQLSSPSATQTSPPSHHRYFREVADWPNVVHTPRQPNGATRNPSSPLKFSFTVEDVARTPARRVPIQDVFPNRTTPLQQVGHSAVLSDLSGQFSKIHAPFLARPVLDPSRSPAKRVPLASSTILTRSGSPTRPIPRARSASVEPKPLRPTLARSHSVEPSPTVPRLRNRETANESTFPKVPVIPRFGAKLPFPLASGQKSRSNWPDTIHEEHAATFVGNPGEGSEMKVQSPVKSQLRQPSAGSRIPRIGAKPYARPLPKDGKPSVTSALRRPVSSTPVGYSTAYCSHPDPNLTPQHLPFVRTRDGNFTADDHSVHADSGQCSPHKSVAATLKRKRGPETVLSPQKSRPVIVHPSASDGFVSNLLVSGKQASTEGSSQKVPGSLKFRKVVDGILSTRPTQTSTNEDLTVRPQPPHLAAHSTAAVEESTEKSISLPESIADDDVKEVPRPSQTHIYYTDATFDANGMPPLTSSPDTFGHLRRTSRRRKLAQHGADVSGGATRPSARRILQSRAEAEGYTGMSATELKALTTSNTTKNQQTVATFATEVIRREGHRPESPTTKARTILQKQQEERGMRRKERAERRARRSDGPGASDTQPSGQAPFDFSIEHNENINEGASRHRRGKEEDFETPEDLEHPFKRIKCDEGAGKNKTIKQVKWHDGLSTVVYLEDLHPKPKSRSKDFVIEKGCLAPAAKNLQLDTLGNIVDIGNRPFPELVPEHIVVKKFLYDNDIESEPVPTRTTRSKSRKAKS
ncbi:hypothetical protein F5I97DRAFT_1924231 [Phlebopus sp. FC_14]|nr:hypothetical protein F5I97DRAFT_1924231 [Phlebopus sp. FC_14]